MLKIATNILFMLKRWDWSNKNEEDLFDVRIWVRAVGLIDFLTHVLLFCRSRFDENSELLKVSVHFNPITTESV